MSVLLLHDVLRIQTSTRSDFLTLAQAYLSLTHKDQGEHPALVMRDFTITAMLKALNVFGEYLPLLEAYEGQLRELMYEILPEIHSNVGSAMVF